MNADGSLNARPRRSNRRHVLFTQPAACTTEAEQEHANFTLRRKLPLGANRPVHLQRTQIVAGGP